MANNQKHPQLLAGVFLIDKIYKDNFFLSSAITFFISTIS